MLNSQLLVSRSEIAGLILLLVFSALMTKEYYHNGSKKTPQDMTFS
jgi:hypothetical protein